MAKKMDRESRDALLMEVFQDRKNTESFLDAVFGFLRRKTNFYMVKTDEDDPDNIPEILTMSALERNTPGVCDKITLPYCGYVWSGVFGNYCWKQSCNDVVVNVHLPDDLESATHLTIDLKMQSLNIRDRTKANEDAIILSGQLGHKVRSTDVVWAVCMADKILRINIEKQENLWWTCFLQKEQPHGDCLCNEYDSASSTTATTTPTTGTPPDNGTPKQLNRAEMANPYEIVVSRELDDTADTTVDSTSMLKNEKPIKAEVVEAVSPKSGAKRPAVDEDAATMSIADSVKRLRKSSESQRAPYKDPKSNPRK